MALHYDYMVDIHWGDYLRGMIRDANVELRTVAQGIGMSPQNFGQQLRRSKPSIDLVEKVFDYFHADLYSKRITNKDEPEYWLPPWITEIDSELLKNLNSLPAEYKRLILASVQVQISEFRRSLSNPQ